MTTGRFFRLGVMGIGVSGALFGLGVSSVFAQWTNSMDLSSFRVVRFGRAALAVSGALMEYSWDDLCESVFGCLLPIVG